jgi:hypothetical protein
VYSTEFFPNYYGTFNTGPYPRLAAFSWDDSMIFTSVGGSPLGFYSTSTFVAGPGINLPSDLSSINSMLTEPTNTLLFIGGNNELLVVGNPMVPLSVTLGNFTIDQVGRTFTGTFSSMRGRDYYLQYSTDLQSWTNLGTSIRGNGQTMTISGSFPAGLTRAFFQITKPVMN